MQRPIYLDYGATTPVDPAVADAMLPWLRRAVRQPAFAAPLGVRGKCCGCGGARAGRGVARLRGSEAVSFTGGATESVNWALKGVLTAPGQTRRRIVTLKTEHSCVLATAEYLAKVGAAVTVLPVERDGAGRSRCSGGGARRRRCAGVGHARQQRDRHDPAGRRDRRAGARDRGADALRRGAGVRQAALPASMSSASTY